MMTRCWCRCERESPSKFIKRWNGEADSVGESVGFFKLGAADLPRLIAETKARIIGPGRAESYDEIIRVLVRDGRFGAVDVTGVPWTEVGFSGGHRIRQSGCAPCI